jgi:hypothetical protein
MKSVILPIFIGVYTHRHGTDAETYLTPEAVKAAQLKIAKDYWETDRADRKAPDDWSSLTDDEIIDAYFDGHDSENFDLVQSEITLTPDDLAKLLAQAG